MSKTQRKLSVVVAGVSALLLLVLAAAPLLAHHAFAAEYDSEKPVKLQGTVKKVEWINPHSWITIEVKRPNSPNQIWEIEAGAPERDVPARLYQGFPAGWNRDRGRWLPREEREAESQWPGSHVP